MARRKTRDQSRNAWWAGIALLAAVVGFSQIWQLWIIPLLTWIVYELCYCPTNCGVQTNRGEPCRNHATGRLYACSLTVHRTMKNRALLDLLPIMAERRRQFRQMPEGGAAATETAEQVSLEPHQRVMVYLIAVTSVVMTVYLVLTIATII
jgi:hypothetical protein